MKMFKLYIKKLSCCLKCRKDNESKNPKNYKNKKQKNNAFTTLCNLW